MADKVEISSQIATQGGGALSIFSFAWIWLGENHVQIAALCAIIGSIVCVWGLISNIKHKRRVEELIITHGVHPFNQVKISKNKPSP